MEPALYSPPRNIDLVIKSRNAAYKLKHGSPKLRDVLRERCRSKVKENRQKYVNILRNASSNELQKVLTDTIRQELMEINDPIESTDGISRFEITNEALIDQELATFERISEEAVDAEVEQIMFNYDALIADEDAVVAALLDDDFVDILECPVCLEGNIVLSMTQVLCTHCNICIRAQTSLRELMYKIQGSVETHSFTCSHKPVFKPFDQSLLMSCSHCSHSERIV